MFAAVTDWLTAAVAALEASNDLASATVNLGPMVESPGGDLVIVGHDDDDETGAAWEWSGEWHDTGASAVTMADAAIPVTVWSQGGGDLTMPERLAACDTLVTAVRAALVPSPSGSDLGVSGVLWGQVTGMRTQLLPTDRGNVARVVLSVTIRCLS